MAVFEPPVSADPVIEGLILKHADRDLDFTDAALIWLAFESGLPEVLTADEKDFAVVRLKGGKRFDIVPWMH
ncbi:MAG: hypothetical protein EHM16_06830 [Betaproteobacteria bacterium]|nr:MAG: hypothetical protein EHM16_06830 [Betaproteobacteria bacterium]